MTKDMERFGKHLVSGIATAKGVDGDFVYITVGDAKRILRMIGEREPKLVRDRSTYTGRMTGYCPSCGRSLDRERRNLFKDKTNFCSGCGQAVKWERED